jgi:hypothetical protein
MLGRIGFPGMGPSSRPLLLSEKADCSVPWPQRRWHLAFAATMARNHAISLRSLSSASDIASPRLLPARLISSCCGFSSGLGHPGRGRLISRRMSLDSMRGKRRAFGCSAYWSLDVTSSLASDTRRLGCSFSLQRHRVFEQPWRQHLWLLAWLIDPFVSCCSSPTFGTKSGQSFQRRRRQGSDIRYQSRGLGISVFSLNADT